MNKHGDGVEKYCISYPNIPISILLAMVQTFSIKRNVNIKFPSYKYHMASKSE